MGLKERLRRSRKLKAACLAASVGTAWAVAGEARAHTVEPGDPYRIRGHVTPAQDLNNAYLLYGTNSSSSFPVIESLGNLVAGQSTPYDLATPGSNEYWFDDQGYVVMGTYDDDGSTGVVVSFADATDIIGQKTWADLFQNPDDGVPDYSEAAVANYLVNGIVDWDTDYNNLSGFFYRYFSDPSGEYLNAEGIIATPYGTDATLVNFSTGTFGGFVTEDETVIPEPVTFAILAGPGLLLMLRRGRGNRAG